MSYQQMMQQQKTNHLLQEMKLYAKDEDSWNDDDPHEYFHSLDLWKKDGDYYPTVEAADKARELLNILFNEDYPIEEGSPIDNILYALSCNSHYGTIKVIAEMQGLDEEELQEKFDKYIHVLR